MNKYELAERLADGLMAVSPPPPCLSQHGKQFVLYDMYGTKLNNYNKKSLQGKIEFLLENTGEITQDTKNTIQGLAEAQTIVLKHLNTKQNPETIKTILEIITHISNEIYLKNCERLI